MAKSNPFYRLEDSNEKSHGHDSYEENAPLFTERKRPRSFALAVLFTSLKLSIFAFIVIGFIGMTALSSLHVLGAEGSETLHLMREVMAWIFGIGLVGLGAYIDVREIKAAGGTPLRIGLIAGATKYILAMVIILAFIPKEGAF